MQPAVVSVAGACECCSFCLILHVDRYSISDVLESVWLRIYSECHYRWAFGPLSEGRGIEILNSWILVCLTFKGDSYQHYRGDSCVSFFLLDDVETIQLLVPNEAVGGEEIFYDMPRKVRACLA
jgi:hypothetical protein